MSEKPMSEREKMITGLPYNCFDSELVQMRRRAKILAREFTNILAPYTEPDRIIYEAFIKEFLPNVTPGSFIEPSLCVDYGPHIYTGKNFYANVGCVLLDICPITFGDNVFLAPGVHVYTINHPLDKVERLTTEHGAPVTIGDDCWIGGKSIICPGVTLGNGVVVAAGSVVTKSFGDDVLIAGCPAVVKKKLNGSDKNEIIKNQGIINQ